MSHDAPPSTGAFLVAALYKFVAVDDPTALRDGIEERCRAGGIRGTVLVAGEGVNGTVAGPPDAVHALVEWLGGRIGRERMELKFAPSADIPFHRLKVRLKPEIVTMRVDGLDFTDGIGTHVEPGDWNDLIADPDTVVIDTRNDYEVAIGTFEGAEDPRTASFTDFPAWAESNRERLEGRRIAMFCTGGIRCEKASAYLKAAGHDEVFHLKGGILRYLEEVAPDESLWRGECFVFDERVSVTHGLERGRSRLCRACRRPLDEAALASPLYEEGVACPECHGERSEADRERYRERQRQVVLAARHGRTHIGS
jgi:UPF0176 protein